MGDKNKKHDKDLSIEDIRRIIYGSYEPKKDKISTKPVVLKKPEKQSKEEGQA